MVIELLDKFLTDGTLPVLDLGCGAGATLEALEHEGRSVVGLDLQAEALYSQNPKLGAAPLLQAEATHLPFKDGMFGAVMLLDVLEHVDDTATLKEVHRVLQRGGLAVISVPAIPSLWSYRDKSAGHLRRYTQSQLKRVLADARLLVEEMRYYLCLLFPLIVFSRLLGRVAPRMRDLEEQPFPLLNTLMYWIVKVELRLSDFILWPRGASLVAVCRKR